jgi:arylamine N-acetyltransferase
VQRYLDLLQVEVAASTLDALRQLTRAHLRRVPFENVSAILRRQAHGRAPVAPLDPDELLQAWCERRAGGVCFEIVAMLDRLLAGLGYVTHPVLAQISFPGSHQANLVELDGRRLLVDVGNGAPFPEPIPLDGTYEVRHAGLAYRFRPTPEPDRWVQDRWIDGEWVPFATYALAPPDPAVREDAYQRHHTPGQSWVVDNLVVTSCTSEQVWSLRDDVLRHFTPAGKRAEQILDPAQYARLAAELFDLPGLPIERAWRALQERRCGAPAVAAE